MLVVEMIELNRLKEDLQDPGKAQGPEALNEMVANLVKFFLLKYLPKQLTSQAEMLKALRDNQEHFPVVFTQASECLQVVVGMEMKELDLSEHCVFGEPRELLTYQQVPDSHPARYECLWGPWAYVETSKWQVMAFVLRVKQRALRAFPLLSAEAAREEE
ncbi:hypothetical protein CapIbe_023279 [Capra ibex]